ncbi:hypothetical protein AG1IA_10480 [Rhizoctonia solani AG-1 IA]|uniref:Uncharacterized protein n=1 Tax=Thanatephorus cucumeris (strain AG1-IA) TaxID=983506 RepID=L8WC00_THACA|nr:hypothetical protein AG1IA_10480 [Rhizoctonia solani AG-1 IA]
MHMIIEMYDVFGFAGPGPKYPDETTQSATLSGKHRLVYLPGCRITSTLPIFFLSHSSWILYSTCAYAQSCQSWQGSKGRCTIAWSSKRSLARHESFHCSLLRQLL